MPWSPSSLRGRKWETVQGEPDLLGKIVQGNLEAEEWRKLSLDSVMANFIHMDAAVDTDSAELEAMATVKVVDSDNAPRDVLSFTSQLATSNPDFTLRGLKSHLVQNLVKKPKVPVGPLPLLVPPFTPSLPPSHLSRVSHTCYLHQNSCKICATLTRPGPNSWDFLLVRSDVASVPWGTLLNGAYGLVRLPLAVQRHCPTTLWLEARVMESLLQTVAHVKQRVTHVLAHHHLPTTIVEFTRCV